MLINMRNGLMAGGALSAKSYVQDGLIAMWDGIENAGWGQHDQNATTWKDLIGDRDLTVRGIATWTSNGLSTATRHGGGIAYRSGYFADETVGALECCMDMRTDTPNKSGRALFVNTNTRSILCVGLDGVRTRGAQCLHMARVENVLISQFSTSVVYGSTYQDDKIYFNGNEMTTEYSSGNWGISNYTRIGGNGGSQNVAPLGIAHCVRVYSRDLPADEITANYAVDKARFGLPDAT